MSTQHEKDNISRLVQEAASGMVPRANLQAALASAVSSGVHKDHVVAIVDGVFGVIATGGTPEEYCETVRRLIDHAYPESG